LLSPIGAYFFITPFFLFLPDIFWFFSSFRQKKKKIIFILNQYLDSNFFGRKTRILS